MAKIAVELERVLERRAVSASPGQTNVRLLANGEDWKVEDVICTAGPQDRPFEERHTGVTIAVVAAGSFQYSGPAGRSRRRELMTPGSLVLGNAGQSFECGHQHGAGDRCISFWYAPHYFERIAANAGAHRRKLDFGMLRLPPLRELSPLTARAIAWLEGSREACIDMPWEELAIQMAAQVVQLAGGFSSHEAEAPPGAVVRVTRILRMIEGHPDGELMLATLAREARLSPFHFLRIFERITGVTPHRYIRRARLRAAAVRLTTETTKILEIALDCGFGDLSNFNHAFRAEFGVSPREYRRQKVLPWVQSRQGR